LLVLFQELAGQNLRGLGEVIGSHGDPYLHHHGGVNIEFCCEPCVQKFNENPKKYLAKLGK